MAGRLGFWNEHHRLVPIIGACHALCDWHQLFTEHFDNNIELDEFAVVPNHVQGVIVIVGAGFPRPGNGFPNIDNHENGRGDLAPTLGQIMVYYKKLLVPVTKSVTGTNNFLKSRSVSLRFYLFPNISNISLILAC